VLAAVVQQIAMDLVGDDQHVAAQAGLRHALQLRPSVQASHRVMGVTEQERAGVRPEGRREGVEVDRVATVRAAGERVLVAT